MTKLIASVSLLEGITHIEELSPRQFINTVKTLNSKIVTEKLDGANLWFGVDERGLYTSREGKSKTSNRFYDVSDYPTVSNYNGFRAAHLALEKVEDIILKHFKDGDQAEIEVLYGRQPNTVTYGIEDKSFIVILRPVGSTTQESVDALSKALNKKQVTVKSKIVHSPDGESVQVTDTDMIWQFTNVDPIDSKKIDISETNDLLSKMEDFLSDNNSVLSDKTNEEVAELSLNSIPKEQREQAKAERERVNNYILDTFTKPIKDLLLGKFVRKIKPFLQADKIHPSEDIGVEGVVVRDPETGEQTKIVDKDVFTAVNTFNSAIRNHIAGLVRTDKQDAPIELRGGAYGQAKIRIADLLGARELALSSGTKKFVNKFKADTPQATAKALADSLNIDNLESVKIKIAAILKNTSKEIQKILEKFKAEAADFRLKLKTDKEIGISPEVMQRTLTAFAETKQDINDVASRVQSSKSPEELVLALYGKTIQAIHNGEDSAVKESSSLLKMVALEAEEGDASVGTQAGDIATPQTLMFHGSKPIERRTRKFVKIKKFPAPTKEQLQPFSLLRKINEANSKLIDMEFATDVDASAAAQNDVEFKQLRNNVAMGNVTPGAVDDYLSKARELNDDVDTVTFGMELDDGKSIVKVYVAANEADNFEKALSELLGAEDDVEKVINDLADKFDIVDVEWPEGFTVDTVGTEPSESESEIVDLDTSNQDPNATGDIDLNGDGVIDFSVDGETENTELEVPTDGESEDDTEPSEVDTTVDSSEEDTAADTEEGADESGGEEDASETDAEPESTDDALSDTESQGADESTDSESSSENEEGSEEVSDSEAEEGTEEVSDSEAEEGTEEDEDEDDDESFLNSVAQQDGKKSKKQKAEESVMNKTIGQIFKEKLLSEAKAKKPTADKEDPIVVAARQKHESQLADFLEAFPTRQARAILTLMISLGVPIKPLISRRSELRDSIEPASDLYVKSASFRMWIKKFLAALNDASINESEDQIDKKLNNRLQHVVYAIIRELGMPADVTSVAQRQLLAGIKSVAKAAFTHPDVRIYLMSIAKELGVEDAGVNSPDSLDEVKESFDMLSESAEDAETALVELLVTLGIDVNANRSISAQLKMQIPRSKLTRLGANTTLLNKMSTLNSLVSKQVD